MEHLNVKQVKNMREISTIGFSEVLIEQTSSWTELLKKH